MKMKFYAALALVLVAVAPAALGGNDQPCESSKHSVMYRVQNLKKAAGPIFWAKQIVCITPGQTTYDVMKTADEGPNPQMSLNVTDDPNYGHFITGINNMFGNHDEQLFWAFVRNDNGPSKCLSQVGVDSYVPDNGDAITFSMEDYGIFDQLPNCKPAPPAGIPGKK